MESADGMDIENPFEEALYCPDPNLVGSEEGGEGEEEGEEEDEEDGDIAEESEGEEGEDEMEEGEDMSGVAIEGVMNILDFVEGNVDEVQLYQQFERIDYEALAERKRKSIKFDDQGHGLVKNPRQTIGATQEEVAEFMNLGYRRSQKKDKKRGRPKGSQNNLSPEITMKLGDATIHYALGHYEAAISVSKEVVRLAENLPDPYLKLGLAHNAKGDKKKATAFYMCAAYVNPKDASLWKRVVTLSIEQGDTDQALYCLSKAIKVDPSDVTLKYHQASLFMEAGDSLKAAETYDQIVRMSHDNFEALKKATMLYNQCGRYENSITMLEDYLKDHPDADNAVVDLLASSYMEQNDYSKALQHIESAERVCETGEIPLHLTIKKGICHVHLADVDKAETCFRLLERGIAEHQTDLMIAVANTFVELQQFHSALKYYLMLEGCPSYNGLVCLKIANCYSALKEAASAIQFFYKALGAHEEDVDIRLTLASLLFEENREDEAIKLLSPPLNSGSSKDRDTDNSEQWWCNVKVKLKLSQFYKRRGMLEAFVEMIYPLVHDSLKTYSMHQNNRLSKHNKFLYHMRAVHKDLIPPMIISGNQFTLISQHQVAATEYLEAYKQMPESPLINLCAGTALINLALGYRLQNKHQCVAQGLAFLYNNLRICENSQEALYNLARACHHVGLVSLAASYYEKVLAIRQEDLPMPEIMRMDKDAARAPKPGYCDLRREAAFNLHLIYKNSGAIDLARQILRNYCTL